jgi:hypothetical protein
MGSWDDYCEICGAVCLEDNTAPTGVNNIQLPLNKPHNKQSKPFSRYTDKMFVHEECFDLFKTWFGRDFDSNDVYTKNKVSIPLSKYHCQYFRLEELESDFNTHLLSDKGYIQEVWKPHFGLPQKERQITRLHPPQDVSEFHDVLWDLKEGMECMRGIDVESCRYYQDFWLDYCREEHKLTLTDLWKACCEAEQWRYSSQPDEVFHTFLKSIVKSKIYTSDPEKMARMLSVYGVDVSPSCFRKC